MMKDRRWEEGKMFVCMDFQRAHTVHIHRNRDRRTYLGDAHPYVSTPSKLMPFSLSLWYIVLSYHAESAHCRNWFFLLRYICSTIQLWGNVYLLLPELHIEVLNVNLDTICQICLCYLITCWSLMVVYLLHHTQSKSNFPEMFSHHVDNQALIANHTAYHLPTVTLKKINK